MNVAVWKWVQKFNLKGVYHCKKSICILIDETMAHIGSNETWLWITVEPIHRKILGFQISRYRNIIVADCIHHMKRSIVERTIEYFKDRNEVFELLLFLHEIWIIIM
jgi:transposase-like protein